MSVLIVLMLIPVIPSCPKSDRISPSCTPASFWITSRAHFKDVGLRLQLSLKIYRLLRTVRALLMPYQSKQVFSLESLTMLLLAFACRSSLGSSAVQDCVGVGQQHRAWVFVVGRWCPDEGRCDEGGEDEVVHLDSWSCLACGRECEREHFSHQLPCPTIYCAISFRRHNEKQKIATHRERQTEIE